MNIYPSLSPWALITGAPRRLGRAAALHLADQGWDIVVHYHRSAEDAATLAEEIIGKGRQAVLAEIDLSNAAHAAGLIPSLCDAIGPIRALINNAALFEPDTHDPDGSRHWAVNREAPRLLSESFLHQTPVGQTGCIINMLDGFPAGDSFTAYAGSKQALREDTLAAAQAFAPRVRVNGLSLGPILIGERQSPEHFEAQLQQTPLKRAATMEEFTAAVSRLLTDDSATGRIIPLNCAN